MSLRLVIVEDEMLIAFTLEAMLSDLGHDVLGIVGRLDEARTLIETCDFDVAILDLKLGSEESYPIADRLIEMGKPFVFSTGYGEAEVADRYPQPVLSKPYDECRLVEVLGRVLSIQ